MDVGVQVVQQQKRRMLFIKVKDSKEVTLQFDISGKSPEQVNELAEEEIEKAKRKIEKAQEIQHELEDHLDIN